MIPPCGDRRAPGCFDFSGPAVQALAPIRLCFICGAASGRLIVSLNLREFARNDVPGTVKLTISHNLIYAKFNLACRAFAVRYDYAAHDFCAVVPR